MKIYICVNPDMNDIGNWKTAYETTLKDAQEWDCYIEMEVPDIVRGRKAKCLGKVKYVEN